MLEGVEVKLNSVVNEIMLLDDYCGVTVYTANGTYAAPVVICTIPLAVLQAAPKDFFNPELTVPRQETIRETHVGALDKIVLSYDRAWWPEKGSFTLLPEDGVVCGLGGHTLAVTSFAAPALPETHPTLLVYVPASLAREFVDLRSEDVVSEAHKYLVRRLLSPGPAATAGAGVAPPKAGHYTNWLGDEFARGATTTPSLVGQDRGPLDFVELGKPTWGGRLGFAGEHADADHRGSVAGAVISGQKEAERVARWLRLHAGGN
jgi:monoamine oxidase